MEPLNETDRRVKRTRKLLQDAFLASIAEKSFQAISVQDIAERADVNRATFYAHFPDKYALLDYVVGDWIRQALARRVSTDSPFTLGSLHGLIVTVLEAFGEFHGHCKPSGRDLSPLIQARVQEEERVDAPDERCSQRVAEQKGQVNALDAAGLWVHRLIERQRRQRRHPSSARPRSSAGPLATIKANRSPWWWTGTASRPRAIRPWPFLCPTTKGKHVQTRRIGPDR
jgi:AcrR family transcriptional regulator